MFVFSELGLIEEEVCNLYFNLLPAFFFTFLIQKLTPLVVFRVCVGSKEKSFSELFENCFCRCGVIITLFSCYHLRCPDKFRQ